MSKKVHFIAVGGAAMHNLALALHKKGYRVTGSDDEIFEPSRSRLAAAGILPEAPGWFPEKITADLDAIILGMHSRKDNPELEKARSMGIRIYSYPEYLYEQGKDKIRIVIGGSHGKTTITSMIMHVLRTSGTRFDYMVGAQVEGFDTMVSLSEEARYMVLEGDEYLASPDDLRPKFHLYHPHIALLSGIAWDHINVFPTFENYVDQFRIFVNMIQPNGKFIYFERDENLRMLAGEARKDIECEPYTEHASETQHEKTALISSQGAVPIPVFGRHNLQNIKGAYLVCQAIGISDEQFYTAISSFKGAAKRLQLLGSVPGTAAYLDFAHAPSKLKATLEAVKEQYPDRKLVACMELHTFSSLNEDFLPQYQGTMQAADEAIVYFNPHTVEHKKLKPISSKQVAEAFGGTNLKVYTDSKAVLSSLEERNWKNTNLLLMTSGNFDGVDFKTLSEKILSKAQ